MFYLLLLEMFHFGKVVFLKTRHFKILKKILINK